MTDQPDARPPDAEHGGQPPTPYGAQPAYYQPSGPAAPEHPQSSTALVLGILGLVVCGVLAPFAWSIGSRTVREIDASGGRLGGRGTANAGRIMGIIGTALLAVGVAFLLFFVLVFGVVGLGALGANS